MLEGFHAKLGEEFMVLLPESIPFLAELMEGERTKLNGRDRSTLKELACEASSFLCVTKR